MDEKNQESQVAQSSSLRFIIIIILVCVLILLTSYAFKNLSPFIFKPSEVSSMPTEKVEIPVSLSNPGVRSMVLEYRFVGNIKEIKDQGDKIKLITNITGAGIPEFVASKSARFVFANNNNIKEAHFNDLKIGQSIVIPAFYRLQSKVWEVNTIIILQKPVQSSQPH